MQIILIFLYILRTNKNTLINFIIIEKYDFAFEINKQSSHENDDYNLIRTRKTNPKINLYI